MTAINTKAAQTVLAVDLGAESGRVIAVHFDGQRLTAEDIHRFPNVPVTAGNTLHWDILRLWGDIQTGIGKAQSPASIGIDTWGVDFGLLDRNGHLLANPVHYRDSRTDDMVDYVFSKVPREQVFDRTGVQIMSINSLYQLASLVKNHDPILAAARHFLTIPDLLYYWLTGVKVNEFSIATTTQCYNPRTRQWATDVLDALEIPSRLFGEISSAGTVLGHYNDVPVVLTSQHDTASAVVAVPARTDQFAFLSSGTWSLLGVELPAPVINAKALAANLTNEGGFNDQILLLKNIMGLWLLQEVRRDWLAAGQDYSYAQLIAEAKKAPAFVTLINPDDALFLKAGDMIGRIQHFARTSGQPQPKSVGSMVRCILESLALIYDYTVRQLTTLSGKSIDTLQIVGGGSQNEMLCQMAADVCGHVVVAGPGEATAIGNAITQLIALGSVGSIAEGRALVRESFPLISYEPDADRGGQWATAKAKFADLVNKG